MEIARAESKPSESGGKQNQNSIFAIMLPQTQQRHYEFYHRQLLFSMGSLLTK